MSSFAAVLAETERVVRAKLEEESTGHDWWHADRVRTTAVRIAEMEGADVVVVALAALLHDVDDYKFSGDEERGPRFAREHLLSTGVDDGVAEHVSGIIRGMSFKGAKVELPELSLEGKCVQDADRLDAMGAIGIARTFAYGGVRAAARSRPGCRSCRALLGRCLPQRQRYDHQPLSREAPVAA